MPTASHCHIPPLITKSTPCSDSAVNNPIGKPGTKRHNSVASIDGFETVWHTQVAWHTLVLRANVLNVTGHIKRSCSVTARELVLTSSAERLSTGVNVAGKRFFILHGKRRAHGQGKRATAVAPRVTASLRGQRAGWRRQATAGCSFQHDMFNDATPRMNCQHRVTTRDFGF